MILIHMFLLPVFTFLIIQQFLHFRRFSKRVNPVRLQKLFLFVVFACCSCYFIVICTYGIVFIPCEMFYMRLMCLRDSSRKSKVNSCYKDLKSVKQTHRHSKISPTSRDCSLIFERKPIVAIFLNGGALQKKHRDSYN